MFFSERPLFLLLKSRDGVLLYVLVCVLEAAHFIFGFNEVLAQPDRAVWVAGSGSFSTRSFHLPANLKASVALCLLVLSNAISVESGNIFLEGSL